MKKVNIYDFFKLYDVGVQVAPLVASFAVQLDKPFIKNVEVMTKNIYTADNSCQTLPQQDFNSLYSFFPLPPKKQV
jgi:hypothetical protein